MIIPLSSRLPIRSVVACLALVGLNLVILRAGPAVPRTGAEPQVTVDKPKDIQVYQGEDVKRNGSAAGPCANVEPPIRFEGNARNGTYQGHMELEVRPVNQSKGTVTAKMEFSDGLLGDGPLDGTMTATTLLLDGRIRAFPGGTFRMQIRGRLATGSMTGTYTLSHTDGSGPQQGQFSLAGHSGVDGRIVGGWAMFVPGGAVSYDLNRGSYTERIQEVSAGTAGEGALVIEADGRYSWNRHGAHSGGQMTYCATPNGESGWVLTNGREKFWARWVGGNRPGLFLSIPGLNMYQFQGKVISSGAAGSPGSRTPPLQPAPGRDSAQKRDSTPPPSDRSSAPSASAGAYVGTWRGINGTGGELKVFSDGTFSFNGARGTYRIVSSDIVFSEPLKAWNNGRAHLTKGSLEFYWQTPAGAWQWFTFGKIQ
jgi:hypothetical protein